MSPLPRYVPLLSAAVLVFCSCGPVHQASATFSTKEAYPSQDAPTSSLELNDDNCLAVHLDLVARHGTRYPSSSSDDFDELEAKLASLRDFLPATGPLSWVRSWTNPFLAAESGQLALRGEKEHYGIAKRFLSRLPSLIGSQYYTPVNFTMMSSSKPRCLQSASAFAFGLFESSGSLGAAAAKFQPVAISSRDLEHDPLMRFYAMCPLYQQGVKKNPAATAEYTEFFSGAEMLGVAARVSARLGLPAGRQLTSASALVMFKVFAFEVAVLNDSRWSGVFTAADGEVLEYAMDLKKYYRTGYGHDINWQISCPLVDALLDTMEDAIKAAVGRLDDGKPRHEPRAVFRFGHAETLIPLLCYMGLFHDEEPLRADNFQRQKNRLFRGSAMAPFGGNVAFVLYHCPQGQGSSSDPSADVFPQFSVKLLINERDVPIPGCAGSPDGSCRFDRLRKLFPTDECNLKKMCRASRQALSDLNAGRAESREAVLKNRGERLGKRGRSDELGLDRRGRGGKQMRKFDYDDDDDDFDDDDDDDWRERRRHKGRRREQVLEYEEYRRRERRLDL